MKKIIILTVSGLFLVASYAAADTQPPSHFCTTPFKPAEFDSEYAIESFKEDVARYENCISAFIDEQNAAIKVHQGAAEAAVNEWNSFVEKELTVKAN